MVVEVDDDDDDEDDDDDGSDDDDDAEEEDEVDSELLPQPRMLSTCSLIHSPSTELVSSKAARAAGSSMLLLMLASGCSAGPQVSLDTVVLHPLLPPHWYVRKAGQSRLAGYRSPSVVALGLVELDRRMFGK